MDDDSPPPSLPIYFGGLLATVLTLLYIKYRQLKHAKSQLPFPDIPYVVPDPHWLKGHLDYLGGNDVIKGQRNIVCKYAGGTEQICSFWTFGTPVFTCLDASVILRILKFTSNRQNNPAIRRHFTRMFGNNSIIMMNGKEWKANRDILQRAVMGHASLQNLQQSITETSLRFESSVIATVLNSNASEVDKKASSSAPNSNGNNKKGQFEIDLVTLSRMACLDVFGLSSLGYDFGCTANDMLTESDVFQQTSYMQQELTRRCFHDRLSLAAQFYSIPVPSNRKLAKTNAALRQKMIEIIHCRRKEMLVSAEEETTSTSDGDAGVPEQQQQRHNDLLSSALKGSKAFSNLTDEYLSDWLITTIFGGYDTTALALAYTLYMLAKNPVYQTECAEEAQHALCWDDKDKLNAQTQNDLPFITACFIEAVRYYPPTATTARSLHRDLELVLDGRKVTLPRGTRCFVSIYWIHHSDINFPRPDEYLPERWAQKNPSTGRWDERTPDNDRQQDSTIPCGNRNAMLAFSAGARNCVGRSLSFQMIPTIVGALLRKCRVELSEPNRPLKLERYGASQAPADGIPVRITLR